MQEHGCRDCAHDDDPRGCDPNETQDWWVLGGFSHGRLCPQWEGNGAGQDLYGVNPYCRAWMMNRLWSTTRAWPIRLCIMMDNRFRAGADEHGWACLQDGYDLPGEALEEALDVAGYAAQARYHGRWSWRWALAVWLAGWIARLMLAEQKRGAR